MASKTGDMADKQSPVQYTALFIRVNSHRRSQRALRRRQNPLCSLWSAVAETLQAFENSGKESGCALRFERSRFPYCSGDGLIQRLPAGLAVAAVISAEMRDREALSLTLAIACLS